MKRCVQIELMMVSLLALLAGRASGAEDWVVPLGTPEQDRTVTGTVTYNNITVSEKVIVSDGAKLSTDNSDAVYFTVAADAVAGADGVVDAVRIGAGGTLAPMKFRNQNAAPARISFAGAGAKLADDRTHWNLNMFTKGGAVVLRDETGDGMTIAQTATYGATGHGFNAADVSVRLVGDGDVTFSRQTGWTSARQSWTLNRGVSIETTKGLYFKSNRSGTYYIAGNDIVSDSVTGITVSGPSGNTTEDYACYLEVTSGCTLRAKNLTATLETRGRVLGAGTVEMGADDSDGTFDAVVRGNTLTVRKIGTGELTIGNSVTNMPTLSIAAGSVKAIGSFPVGRLSIASGASLVVDGGRLVIGAADAATVGRIVTRNGGTVVAPTVDVPAGVKVELRGEMPDDSGIEYVRSGEGTSVIFGNTCPATSLHVKGGAVKFSTYGLTDRFLRFTFKRTWGWLNYSNVRQDPSYLQLVEIGLYDRDGARLFSSSSSVWDVTAVASGSKHPSGLTGLSMMAQEGTVFASDSTHNSLVGLFNHNYEGYFPYFRTVKLDDEAYEAGKFERFYFHSRDTDPAVHGYNMACKEYVALPRTWTIEASPDGTDGSWYVVSERIDYRNGFSRDDGWLNGVRYKDDGKADQGLHTVFTNYVSSGVAPNVTPISVEVENGATIDFGTVTGGQPVGRIAYDLTTGGGVINAARLASSGVFEFSDELGQDVILKLKLTNVLDADNLKSWTVKAGGRTIKKVLKVASDGTLYFDRKGLVLLFR